LPEKKYRPGETVGGWRIVAELEGGDRSHYRVGRAGAPDAELLPLPLDRVLRERIDLVKSLRHENLHALIDAGDADDSTFIVRELIGGWSVASWLEREKKLTYDQALGIACQLCLASTEAAKAGIGFLALNPERVLVDNDGFAKADPLMLQFAGDQQYLSPEERRGDPPDGRSDVFRIALMIYRMLAGRLPERDGFGSIRYQPLGIDDAKLPAALDETLIKALADDPADRFGSTDDLLDLLHPLLMRRPLPAGTAPTSWHEDKRFWLYVAIALAAAVVVLGIIFGLPPLPFPK
jgi:serine/threonine protein kinase